MQDHCAVDVVRVWLAPRGTNCIPLRVARDEVDPRSAELRYQCPVCIDAHLLLHGGTAYGAANDVVVKFVASAAEVRVQWNGVLATLAQASCPTTAGSLAHPTDVEYILRSF